MKKLIDTLRIRLAKTKNGFVAKIAEAVKLRTKIDKDLLLDIEDILIEADIGVSVSEYIISKLSDAIRVNRIEDPSKIMLLLSNIITSMLEQEKDPSPFFESNGHSPYVIMFVGVNGVGKTTTIGKLAYRFTQSKKSVMLIAADTFRAAAIEQLTIWAERSGSTLHKHQAGADPSSVIFDGLNSAVNKKTDIVMIDTAGRLHNKVNLMNELSKMDRTIKKVLSAAPHRTILVVDASTGQNAISQAKVFNEIVHLDGIALTKLDGTAKGGIVIGINQELEVPVKLIGIGEKLDDLKDFNSEEFVEALFG